MTGVRDGDIGVVDSIKGHLISVISIINVPGSAAVSAIIGVAIISAVVGAVASTIIGAIVATITTIATVIAVARITAGGIGTATGGIRTAAIRAI